MLRIHIKIGETVKSINIAPVGHMNRKAGSMMMETRNCQTQTESLRNVQLYKAQSVVSM